MERSYNTNSAHLHKEFAHLAELAAAAKSGDAEAKARMTEVYKPLLGKWLSFALKRHSSAEREEVMGELNSCFLSVLENFDPDRGLNFTVYADTVLGQRVRHWLREEHKRFLRHVSLEEASGGSGDCEESSLLPLIAPEVWEEALLRVWLDQALEQLPEREGQIVRLMLEGSTEQEIAVELSLSRSNVYKLKQKALAFLREEYTR